MFSSRQRLAQRTPDSSVDREQFIQLLVQEFHQTKSIDAKRQVLANLSNLSYDPLNAEWLRRAGAVPLLCRAAQLEERALAHFASAGIFNLCLDPVSAALFIQSDVIAVLVALLSATHEETVLNAAGALAALAHPGARQARLGPAREHLERLAAQDNPRLRNVARICLEIDGSATADKTSTKSTEITE